MRRVGRLSAFQADVGYYPIDIRRLPAHDLRAFDGVLSLMFQLEQATLDQAHEVVARLDTLASAKGASQLWQREC